LAFNFRVIPALTVGGSAAYTNARLTSTAPVIDVTSTGARLPLSPRYNFALIGTYNFNIIENYSGALNVTDRWVGERLAGFGTPKSPQYNLASYNVTDLNLSIFAPRGLEYGLYLRNVFDRAGEVSASILANEYNPASPVPVVLTQPRTVGLSVKYKFN
jgi:iron complex outermembrane recepter protein